MSHPRSRPTSQPTSDPKSHPASDPSVAVLGLGAMGSRMAARLLDAGHRVTVWNRSPGPAEALEAAGARRAPSPAAAATEADIVLSMVRDDEAARSVWLDPEVGALTGLRANAVALECSTVTPAWVRELGEAAGSRADTVLDAPVVGTRPHAETGLLTFLVGGDEERLDSVRPVLEVMGSSVHHCGPRGAGAVMKLTVNALFATQVAAVAELLAALGESPVAPTRAVEVLNALPTASPAAARATELMAEGHTAPNFPIDLVAKDLGYAADLVRRAGVGSRVVAGTRAAFEAGVERGLGETDIVGITALYAGGRGA